MMFLSGALIVASAACSVVVLPRAGGTGDQEDAVGPADDAVEGRELRSG